MATIPAGDQQAPYRQWILSFAELAVVTVLDTVSARLLRRAGRSARHHSNGLRTLERHQRYTRLPPPQQAELDELVADTLRVFDATAPAGPDRNTVRCVRASIAGYVTDLVAHSRPHDRDQLAAAINSAGCVDV